MGCSNKCSTSAIINEGDSVVTWGRLQADQHVGPQFASGVKQVAAHCTAVAAVREDDSVITCGDDMYGGDSTAVHAQLSSGAKEIVASGTAFTAVKHDGSIITWGFCPGEEGCEVAYDVVSKLSVQSQISK